MEAESDAGAGGFGPIVVTTLDQQTPNWDLKINLQCWDLKRELIHFVNKHLSLKKNPIRCTALLNFVKVSYVKIFVKTVYLSIHSQLDFHKQKFLSKSNWKQMKAGAVQALWV